jgi:homogentisate 1,2-dioxygenase
MLDRMVVGDIPRKHHIVLRDAEGNLRHEECMTRDGFEGPYTIAYHAHRPHAQHLAKTRHGFAIPEAAPPRALAKRHYRTHRLAPARGAPVDARVPLLFNEDVTVSVLHPDDEDPVYFSNSDADDLFYVFRGSGTVRSVLGDLRFEQDDYVCIPRGMIHRIIPDAGVEQHWVAFELAGSLHLLKQWRNETGQLRMDAPYSHRDFRRPSFRGPLDEGIRELTVKRENAFHGFRYDHSPLDVVGWDGTVYPWAFPILNFQPRAGLVHLPPTWHGTFGARGALICSFVPRAVDFHPEAIPCPYPHSSYDCDEILFYSRGNFTSRRGVAPGSVSHHPAGIPHGPHPGAYEASIGHRETSELAVMMDVFRPLRATSAALTIEDPSYQESFIA